MHSQTVSGLVESVMSPYRPYWRFVCESPAEFYLPAHSHRDKNYYRRNWMGLYKPSMFPLHKQNAVLPRIHTLFSEHPRSASDASVYRAAHDKCGLHNNRLGYINRLWS